MIDPQAILEALAQHQDGEAGVHQYDDLADAAQAWLAGRIRLGTCQTCEGEDPGCSCGACGIAEGYGYAWCTNYTGCPSCHGSGLDTTRLVKVIGAALTKKWPGAVGLRGDQFGAIAVDALLRHLEGSEE